MFVIKSTTSVANNTELESTRARCMEVSISTFCKAKRKNVKEIVSMLVWSLSTTPLLGAPGRIDRFRVWIIDINLPKRRFYILFGRFLYLLSIVVNRYSAYVPYISRICPADIPHLKRSGISICYLLVLSKLTVCRILITIDACIKDCLKKHSGMRVLRLISYFKLKSVQSET